jgi:hypothetical protein
MLIICSNEIQMHIHGPKFYVEFFATGCDVKGWNGHTNKLLIIIAHKHNVLLCVKLPFKCCDYHWNGTFSITFTLMCGYDLGYIIT